MSAKLKSKKFIIIIIVVVLLVAIVSVNVASAFFFSLSFLKKDGSAKLEEYLYGEQLPTESQWIEKRGEEIQIKNDEAQTLTAINIKNEHVSNSYIIMCHQYGGGPQSMEEYAKHFYALGFNIILPYMRGHGESSYENISFGINDKPDVLAWVKAVTEKDKTAKIALFGVSLGANAVTLAAAEDLPENVRLVISDSCFTSVTSLVEGYIENETGFSSFIGTGIVAATAEKKIGKNLKSADTVDCLEDVQLPIMFINGENDTAVPPIESKRLYENCEAKGVEEVIIQDGVHGRNLKADKVTYWANVDAFVLTNIGI